MKRFMVFWDELTTIFLVLEGKAKGKDEMAELERMNGRKHSNEWNLSWINRLWEIISACASTAARAAVSDFEGRIKTLEGQMAELSERITANDTARKQDFTDFERKFSNDDIARMLVANPSFVKDLSLKLSEYERTSRQESESDKRQSIREIVAQLKGIKDPTMVNEELVKSLYDSRVLYRTQRSNWSRLLEQEIISREERMKQSILSMVSKTNQKKVDEPVAPFAQILVALAVSPEDKEEVLSALYEEDTEKTVVQYLLKSYKREA